MIIENNAGQARRVEVERKSHAKTLVRIVWRPQDEPFPGDNNIVTRLEVAGKYACQFLFLFQTWRTPVFHTFGFSSAAMIFKHKAYAPVSVV